MEVHTHTHTPRKKWIHYLWEFLMLFLAVFCGFLAENLRDHYIEKKRERQYVIAIVNDLAADTIWMNAYMHTLQVSVQAFDSVIVLLNQNDRDDFRRKRLYFLARMAIRTGANKAHDNAYEQMKSSGNLRLLHKQAILDSISNYYFYLKDIELINNPIYQRAQALIEFEGKLFDGNVFRQMTDINSFEFHMPESGPPLLTEDKTVINDFIVRVHYFISVSLFAESFIKQQRPKSIRLIRLLEKEYNL